MTITLAIEVRPDGGLSGRAVDERGATREFAGWLGLTAAVDALLDAESRRRPDSHRAPSTR